MLLELTRLVKLSILGIGLQLFHTPNGGLTVLCLSNNVDLRIGRKKEGRATPLEEFGSLRQ